MTLTAAVEVLLEFPALHVMTETGIYRLNYNEQSRPKFLGYGYTKVA
jgi:hypothetical protein